MKAPKTKKIIGNISYAVFLLLFTLIASEVLLRLFNQNRTWSEKVGQGYVSGYGYQLNSWLFTRPADSVFEINQGDYKYWYQTNSLGIREKENPFTDSTAAKMVCMGDSYTEGMGAPYDSSYPRFLERELNEEGFKVQIYNAGVASSDPFFVSKLLEQKILRFHPGYVLITFNSSDLTDYIFRGGAERFKADGTTQYKPAPAIEKYYSKCRLLRLICKMIFHMNNNLFVRQKNIPSKYAQAVADYALLFDSMNTSLQEKGIQLLVIVQPIASELAYERKRNVDTYNAFDEMDTALSQRNILFIDMRGALTGKITTKNIAQYAYPNDAHFNSAGYQLFSENLLAAIQSKYPDFFSAKSNGQ